MKMHEILLIDDDPIINFINSKVIKSEFPDKKTTIFEGGAQALNYIREHPQNNYLIFLDIHMPKMTGWDFIRIISQEKMMLNLQIYILTSSIDKIDLKKAEENDFVLSYLPKPLKLDVLKKIFQ